MDCRKQRRVAGQDEDDVLRLACLIGNTWGIAVARELYTSLPSEAIAEQEKSVSGGLKIFLALPVAARGAYVRGMRKVAGDRSAVVFLVLAILVLAVKGDSPHREFVNLDYAWPFELLAHLGFDDFHDPTQNDT